MSSSTPTDAHLDRVPNRFDFLLALLLGLVSFGLYVRTLLPGLVPSDGAEFQTLAYVLDHAHTTGYEVYMLLARLFVFLPVKDVAYRVNLFSAFLGGGTIGFLYLAARTLSGSRWGAGLAAAALAVCSTFWSQAIIAEVYTAGSIFSAAILFLLLLWNETRRGRWLLLAGLLGGMAIGVHGSVLLVAPAVALLLLLNLKDLRNFWKPALVGTLLGILVMLAAFISVDMHESNASVINNYTASISRWDMTPDQIDSFAGRFTFLVFAKQWRSAMFSGEKGLVPQNMALLSKFFANDFALVVRLLILLGALVLVVRRPRLGLFFAAAVVFHLFYTLNYRIGDLYVFFISLYVLLLPLAAEGIALFEAGLKRLPGMAPRLFKPVLGACFILLALLPFSTARLDALRAGEVRFDFMWLPSNAELLRWHQTISFNAKSLPQNAVVLMGWDNLYGYAYAANVELNRPDLLFLEAYPYANKAGMADSLFVYLKAKMAKGCPVYAAERLDELERGGFTLKAKPVGVTEMFLVEQR
jgi:hypothetical protein